VKVDLFVFSYRNGPASARDAISVMRNYALKEGIDVHHRDYGNALIHRARNTALAAMRPDADFALFVDDDMVPPTESIIRLAAHDVPVVSALCTTRVPPVEIAAKVYDPIADQFCPLECVNLTRLITGQFGIGTGFVMNRRDAVEALCGYYLSAHDWLDENRRRMDRLHVRSENREKERKRLEQIRMANWAKEKHLRVFSYFVGENEMELGEDITFSRRLIRLRIPVSIDGTLIPGHIGERPYSVYDVLNDEENVVKVA